MRLKTAAGIYNPLLALGIAAVVGGCATKPDAQPSQFAAAPVIEAVYARDSAGPNFFGFAGLPDVQMWANPADAHYPTQTNETGAQNAANVSPLPASYSSLVVEFNIPLDGSKFGVQNDLGSYCSIGKTPGSAPFTVTDVTSGSATPLLGSICYDPTSPLYRYPSLTYVVGQDVSANSSLNPFTCQAFNPEDFNGADNSATFTAFVPTHQYAITLNTAVITNQTDVAVAAPPTGANAAMAGWTGTTFDFNASGFEIMAAGYQDQNTGYYTFISKPYKGFLKDLAEVGAAGYQQPADDTPFFIFTTYALNVDGNDCFPADNTDTDVDLTAVRTNGTGDAANFGALIYNDFCDAGLGLISFDPRSIYVLPALATPGFDGPANGGSGTWEPGQSYTITVPATIASFDKTATLAAGATYTFTASPGDPSPLSSAPTSGGLAQPTYAGNGPGLAARIFGGATAITSTMPSHIVVDYNAPIDPTLATTANFTVTAAGSSTPVAGTVSLVPNSNEQAIIFIPAAALATSTVYTIDVNNLKVDPAIPGFNNAAFPEYTSTFTTATVRAASFSRECVTYPNKDECAGVPGTLVSADRAANQPLQTLFDGWLRTAFTREIDPATISSADVTVNEVSSTGATTPVPAADVTILNHAPGSTGVNPLRFYTMVSNAYPVKCGQTYQVVNGNAITDSDETPEVAVNAEGCKAPASCPDVKQFTTQVYEPLPQDASGNPFLFTPTDGTTPDTISLTFNASLSAASVNPLIAAGFIQLVDSNGASVPITCPALPDDNQFTISCTTNAPLALNSSYEAIAIVDANAPIKIATTTLLDPVNAETPTGTFTGDQTTCQFFGSLTTAIETACPATTGVTLPRHPAHKATERVSKQIVDGQTLSRKLALK